MSTSYPAPFFRFLIIKKRNTARGTRLVQCPIVSVASIRNHLFQPIISMTSFSIETILRKLLISYYIINVLFQCSAMTSASNRNHAFQLIKLMPSSSVNLSTSLAHTVMDKKIIRFTDFEEVFCSLLILYLPMNTEWSHTQ